MGVDREILEVDVLFIGAGPASLSGALHLQNLIDDHNRNLSTGQIKLNPSIAVIERDAKLAPIACLGQSLIHGHWKSCSLTTETWEPRWRHQSPKMTFII